MPCSTRRCGWSTGTTPPIYATPTLRDPASAAWLHPMCNYRDYHATTKGSLEWNFGVEALPGGCKIIAYEGAAPAWLTSAPAAEFTHTGVWYWNFVYRKEIERGFEGKEDLY